MSYRNVIAAASVLVITAMASTFAQADSVTVATYGGEWGDAIRDCISQPFTKATGNTVTPEPGVSGVTLAKLKQQAGSPVIDVAWLDGGVSELAAEANLLDSLPFAKIPGLGKIIPEALYKTSSGEVFGVGTGYYALGITYNTKTVKAAPTSWEDLWKKEFSGTVTIPSPANAMGIPFLLAINKLQGGTPKDIKRGLDKIKQMKVSGFFDTAGAATNSFQSEEVVIGANYATTAWGLADKKLPIAYAVPKEGALGGDIRLHLVKGTKHVEAARAFIDFAIAPAQASCMSNRLFIGPATQGTSLTEAAQQRMPWGKGGSVANLLITDWNVVNANRAAINDQWNRALAR